MTDISLTKNCHFSHYFLGLFLGVIVGICSFSFAV